jgi:hypothetical protein
MGTKKAGDVGFIDAKKGTVHMDGTMPAAASALKGEVTKHGRVEIEELNPPEILSMLGYDAAMCNLALHKVAVSHLRILPAPVLVHAICSAAACLPRT